MTTEIYNKIKTAASQTEDDSILGATVRRILQEARALEAMDVYDSNQLVIDSMITETDENDGIRL
jgi:hypothetical protein